MSSRVRRAIEAHELAAFYLLACAFSWTAWTVMLLGDSPFATIAAIVPVFGPAVGAVIVVKATGRSLRAWVRSLGPVPGEARWYLAAVLLIGTLFAITTGTYMLAGGELTAPAVTVPVLLVALLISMTLGGGLEELGWRGYLLPRLQRRWSPVGASVIVGVGWAVWHLPLFVLPGAQNVDQPFWTFGLIVIAMSFAFTWLYNVAGGSILPVILLHGLNNTSSLLYPFAADTSMTLNLTVGLVASGALAAVLLLATRGRLAGERGPVRSADERDHPSPVETGAIAD